jgi:hypothetical protein
VVRQGLHFFCPDDAPVSIVLQTIGGDLTLLEHDSSDSSDRVKPDLHNFDLLFLLWRNGQIVMLLDLLFNIDFRLCDDFHLVAPIIQLTHGEVHKQKPDGGDDEKQCDDLEILVEESHFH